MNRWSRLVLVGAAFWLAVALTLNIAVKALDNVQVSVNAPAEVGEGSDFVARVNIAEVISFGAANYDITYDPDVLEVTNVTNGLIGVTTITVDMWRVVAAGRLRVIGNVVGLGMVSGSGYLAEIHFHTVGTAGSSGEINISNGVLSNSHANEIMATWIGCLVRVSATAITPNPTPSPAPSPTPESTQGGGGGDGYIPPQSPTPTPTLLPSNAAIPVSSPTPSPAHTPLTTFKVYLQEGWNLFSFNVILVDSNTEAVLSPIQGKYLMVETFEGVTLSYSPSLPQEENTLTELDPYHGYWIKMKQADTLSITGYPLASTTPLSLAEGWNLVSYLGDRTLPVSTALSSIDGLYTAVLGYDGEGLSFYTSVPAEMNTLESLKPGYGYWIKMNIAANLVYPGSD